MKPIRWLLFPLIFCFAAWLGFLAGREGNRALAADTTVRPALFFNITSGQENIHAVSMALSLANSARKNGHEVTVFLNTAAPFYAAANLSSEVKFADFPPVKSMLSDLVSAGAKVYVCEHCAHVVGIDPQATISGIAAAKQAEILERLKPGTIALSF